jgi:uncharacterized protein
MELNILIDEEEKKFYAVVEDRECHLCYELLPDGVIKFTSTYVPHSIRTKGIAWELAAFAFNYAAENQLKVIPRCGYIRRFVDKNPELKELLKDRDSYL